MTDNTDHLIRRLREPIDWAHFVSEDHAVDYYGLLVEAAAALEKAEARVKTLEGLVSQGISGEHDALGRAYKAEARVRELEEVAATSITGSGVIFRSRRHRSQ